MEYYANKVSPLSVVIPLNTFCETQKSKLLLFVKRKEKKATLEIIYIKIINFWVQEWISKAVVEASFPLITRTRCFVDERRNIYGRIRRP